ncbi:hypothetical protein [Nitrincola alkalilacustris]|uniref:hypothetical protein n=1 Tax=Nitrincola alkalilacustris TaxID=1571224 RepID=UPI00124CBEAD|nr:hypothetical protein [Nitrincola alkalilacustris]
MSALKAAGLILIVLGVVGLAYGSFSFTKETHEANLGPISLSVQEKETINVPVWAGIGSIAVGTFMLLAGSRRR